MGLFDNFAEFVKTPAGTGLLTALASGAAGAKRGTPWNNFGRAGVAGLLGYQSAQDNQFTAELKKMQMEEARDKAAERQGKEADRAAIQAALMGSPESVQFDEQTGAIIPSTMQAAKHPTDFNSLMPQLLTSRDDSYRKMGADLYSKQAELQQYLDAIKGQDLTGIDPLSLSSNERAQKLGASRQAAKDKAEQKAADAAAILERQKEMQAIITGNRPPPVPRPLVKIQGKNGPIWVERDAAVNQPAPKDGSTGFTAEKWNSNIDAATAYLASQGFKPDANIPGSATFANPQLARAQVWARQRRLPEGGNADNGNPDIVEFGDMQ